ncbi:hypothetical protein D0809_07110 [Flavobacterium circumlabens]|uniref:Uncharacterized protein n=1 Tax=Flavobacterium circumlabens TaxID=2133765 RepID=A0A4Y7UF03_9FLAO|nr:hypothetical protein [Flavobacterium circumlabens]TCN59676.1 hypothetical protein EV142_102294 [Flavobacterium circumlabens]TEB44944.1 hypothetical protein D0809_07110 [Flavobacterium circumlabens]
MKTIDKKTFDETASIDLTIGSFIISTLLFVMYILSNENSNVLVIASPFVFSAIVLNTIMLLHLTDLFIRMPELRRDIGIKILILLSNIPITFLYYCIVMKV